MRAGCLGLHDRLEPLDPALPPIGQVHDSREFERRMIRNVTDVRASIRFVIVGQRIDQFQRAEMIQVIEYCLATFVIRIFVLVQIYQKFALPTRQHHGNEHVDILQLLLLELHLGLHVVQLYLKVSYLEELQPLDGLGRDEEGNAESCKGEEGEVPGVDLLLLSNLSQHDS
jgi:hypothetical protein